MFIVKRIRIKLVTILQSDGTSTAALIFSLISTLSKTFLIFFPSIWDTEKSNDSPQRIIADGSSMLSSLISDSASPHSTAMRPK